MRLFALIALLMTTTMSFAEVEIAAVIHKGSLLYENSIIRTRIPAKQFPLASYEVVTMTSYFRFLKSDESLLDKSSYNLLTLQGKLKLIAYNPQTEHYQFKFTFEPLSGLIHMSPIAASYTKGKAIKGEVLFDANNTSSIIVEGEIQHNFTDDGNELPIPPKENPSLMFLSTFKKEPTEIIITASYDIPITIKSIKVM